MPAALRWFIAWTGRFLIPDPEVVLRLHLHVGSDGTAAKPRWCAELGRQPFTRTFIKGDGTG